MSQDLKIDNNVLKKICEQIRQEKYTEVPSIAKFKWSERYVSRLGQSYGLLPQNAIDSIDPALVRVSIFWLKFHTQNPDFVY